MTPNASAVSKCTCHIQKGSYEHYDGNHNMRKYICTLLSIIFSGLTGKQLQKNGLFWTIS